MPTNTEENRNEIMNEELSNDEQANEELSNEELDGIVGGGASTTQAIHMMGEWQAMKDSLNE